MVKGTFWSFGGVFKKGVKVVIVVSLISTQLVANPTTVEAATYTTTWTTQGDFESNTAGNGGDFATTTSVTRGDTTTSSGTLGMGPGTVQVFTDPFSNGSYIDYSVSTATTSDVSGSLSNPNIPKAHWTFDEGSGTSAADSSGNSNTGTLNGGVSWTSGRIGSSAISLNGTSGRVSVGNNTVLNMTSNNQTISAWIYPKMVGVAGASSTPDQAIFDRDDHGCGPSNGYSFRFNGGGYGTGALSQYGSSGGGCAFLQTTQATQGTYTASQWQLLTVTNTNGTVKYYVNSTQYAADTTNNYVSAHASSTQQGYIGGSAINMHYFNGYIDDLRIYNRALSASEVSGLYNETFGTGAIAQSSTLATVASGIAYAQIAATSTLNGGTVTYQLSNDNGSTWTTFTPGSSGTYGTQTSFSGAGTQLKYKITLTGSATVDAISISYNGYSTTVLSNVKKDAGGNAIMTTLSWNVSRPTNTQVTFRTRGATAAQGPSALYSAEWSDVYTAANGAGSATIKANGAGGASNPTYRYIEIEATLTSDNGIALASINEFTLTYVINGPPNFDPTYGNSGASASVSTTEGSTWGKVQVSYSVRDTDATSGGSTPNAITPSFEYSLNGGSSWSAISSGYLGASDLSNKTVAESAYNTYSATWDAVGQLGANTYTSNAIVRVTANDNEPVNNTISASSAAFTLDTTPPSVTFRINGTDGKVSLTATDNSNILDYSLSNSSDLSGATTGSGTTTTFGVNPAWTFSEASTSVSVYSRIRDIYGNTSSTTAVGPITPSYLELRDVSLPTNSDYREFLVWTAYPSGAPGTAAFSKYELYRATGGGSYSLLTTITTQATNYYVDTSVASTSSYSYKIRYIDTDTDSSPYSSIATDTPDGTGGTDTVAPSITSVTVSNVKSSSAKITWTTDELSNSSVNYGTTVSYGSIASSSAYQLSHEVYLTNLSPSTTYYLKVNSIDIAGNLASNNNSGASYSFTTTSGPVISGVVVENITNNSAQIYWNTSTTSNSSVNYGTSSSLSSYSTVSSTTLSLQHRINITGLTTNTTYYFTVSSTDGESNQTIDNNSGTNYTFTTTLDSTGPVISAIDEPVIAPTQTVITWVTDELATSRVEYGTVASTTSGSYATLTALDSTLTKQHVVTLSDLTKVTTYYYRVRSADAGGNNTTSDENSFTTTDNTVVISGGGGGGGGATVDSAPPVISDIKIVKIGALDATISFRTDEDTRGTLQYGFTQDYNNNATNLGYATNHTIVLRNLRMNTVYHFRVNVVDKGGNISVSADQTFKTNTLTENLGNLKLLETTDPDELQKKIDDLIESALPSLNPPFIDKPIVEEITEDSATLTWNTNVKSFGIVSYSSDEEYTKDKNYTATVSEGETKTLSHKVILSNLKTNTKYHFQIGSFVFPGVVGTTDDITFITKAAVVQPQILDRKKDSFRVVWTTPIKTTSVVEYKRTGGSAYNKKSDDKLDTYHDIKIENLLPGVSYDVKVYGYTADGNIVEAKTTIVAITSRDVTAPKIESFKVDSALVPGRNDRTQTVVSWNTDEPATSVVRYEEGSGSADKELANKQEDGTFSEKHVVILTNLKPGTIYRFQIESADDTGNKTVLPVRTIVTPRQTESIVDVIFKNFEDTFQFLR